MHLQHNHIGKLPNLGNALQKMDLILKIDRKLCGVGELWAYSIKLAIENKQPHDIIIRTLQAAIADNEDVVAFRLGDSLTGRIKNFVL